MKKNLDSIVSAFNMCISFSLLITALGITNMVLTNTIERRREISLLRTLGSSRLQIALCFVSEALTIGWIGYVTGFAMGLSFWRFFSPALIGPNSAPIPDITSALFFNSFFVATLTTVVGTVYPVYSIMQAPSIERMKSFVEIPAREVRLVKISDALMDTLRRLDTSSKSPYTMNFRVPDSLARSLALTFIRLLPKFDDLTVASTWEAESNAHKFVNCVLILRFDHDLPLRHVPQILTGTSDSVERVVLIPESTFNNLSKESQELIPWFLEPRIEGGPESAYSPEVSDSKRDNPPKD